MTAEEKELFYDTYIAPRLLELGRLCEDAGLPFVAAVEWDADRQADGGWGSTITAPPTNEISAAMYMILRAAQVAPNFDAYIIEMMKFARERGPGTSAELDFRLRGFYLQPEQST